MDFEIEPSSANAALAAVAGNRSEALDLPFGGGEVGAVERPEALAAVLEIFAPVNVQTNQPLWDGIERSIPLL